VPAILAYKFRPCFTSVLVYNSNSYTCRHAYYLEDPFTLVIKPINVLSEFVLVQCIMFKVLHSMSMSWLFIIGLLGLFTQIFARLTFFNIDVALRNYP